MNNPSTPTKNNGIAILCYLGILIIIPFVTGSQNDPYIKFHMKQGLTLIVTWVVSWILMMIPIIGWVLGWVLWLITIVLLVIGIINAATGKEKQLPIIGKYASKFNF